MTIIWDILFGRDGRFLHASKILFYYFSSQVQYIGVIFAHFMLNDFFLGLLKKWYDEVENALIAQKAAKKLATDPVFSFNLEDMQTAFYILGIGWLTCLMVLALETLCPTCSCF